MTQWLNRRRSTSWCLAAWGLATFIFVSLTVLLGGPSQADSSQSVYSALLIAHGDLSCAYPSPTSGGVGQHLFTSPLFTLLSAGAAKVINVGGAYPFPSATRLGVDCSQALARVMNWVQISSSLSQMMKIGFIVWPVLASGVIAMLRVCGRGRDGREAALLLAIACSAPVFACLESFFHPEDLLAMGIILLALASFVRERWILAGLFVGLAMLAQLFTILAIIPIAMVLPNSHRFRFGLAAIGSFGLVVAPLAIATSGHVFRAIFLSTSRAGSAHVAGAGGTLIFAIGLHGPSLFVAARVMPMAVAAILSWFVWSRLQERSPEPVVLLSLVGTCLAMRLVFEVNAFNYYYMATVVSLLLLDALRGRFSGRTFALIWLVTLAYSPIAWGYLFGDHPAGPFLHAFLPYVASVPVIVVIVLGLLRRRVLWYLVVWQILVLVAFIRVHLPESHYKAFVPSWCWQILLVPPLLYLLTDPLRRATRRIETIAPTTDVNLTS